MFSSAYYFLVCMEIVYNILVYRATYEVDSSVFDKHCSGDSFTDIKEEMWNTIDREIQIGDCSLYRYANFYHMYRYNLLCCNLRNAAICAMLQSAQCCNLRKNGLVKPAIPL